MPYTVSVLDRALTLLEVLAEHPDSGVTELAKLTGNTKTLVFRLIFTLEQRGYVIKDPVTRTYRLGYRALFLAANVPQQSSLIRVAEPFLDELAAQCRENVNLLVREGRFTVCVALRESPQPLRLYAQVGRPGPLHAGGGSKLLLAFAPAAVQREVLAAPLQRYTEHTIADPARLTEVLERIRRDEAHESFSDLDEGAFSFAAPVRDHSDAVIAALSIAGPISRLDEAQAARYRDLVRDQARALSRALGWQVRGRQASA